MKPTSVPRIDAAPLRMRPIERADGPAWLAIEALPQMQQLTSSTVATLADLQPIFDRLESGEPGSPITFAIEDAAGALVGSAGFHSISALFRTAELSYSIAPPHWGRGYATACCDALARWGFEAQGYVRIQATTLLAHAASQRVLAKCGFEREGLLRNFRIVRGQPMDYLVFSRLPPNAR